MNLSKNKNPGEKLFSPGFLLAIKNVFLSYVALLLHFVLYNHKNKN